MQWHTCTHTAPPAWFGHECNILTLPGQEAGQRSRRGFSPAVRLDEGWRCFQQLVQCSRLPSLTQDNSKPKIESVKNFKTKSSISSSSFFFFVPKIIGKRPTFLDRVLRRPIFCRVCVCVCVSVCERTRRLQEYIYFWRPRIADILRWFAVNECLRTERSNLLVAYQVPLGVLKTELACAARSCSSTLTISSAVGLCGKILGPVQTAF